MGFNYQDHKENIKSFGLKKVTNYNKLNTWGNF